MDKRYILAVPLLEVAIELKRPADSDRLMSSLEKLAADDGSFACTFDPDTGLATARGMSEEHLDACLEALRRVRTIDLETGAPQVVYRECIVAEAEIDHTHAKQFGGGGEFARVVLLLAPGAANSGFVFENKAGIAVRDDLVPGVIKGLEAARKNGVVAGFPLSDFKATLVDGVFHELDSTADTFEAATRGALRKLKNTQVVRLLEPIMAVEITGLQQLRDIFIEDLKARRGEIDDRDVFVVRALVPLANMLGYQNVFPTLSKGYGRFTMKYSHHQATSFDDDDPGPFRSAMAMRA